MIPNYSYPQTLIAQELATETFAELSNDHALIIGPAYRHTSEGTLVWSTYAEASSITYTSTAGGIPNGGILDEDTVTVRGKNLLFDLWTKEPDSVGDDCFVQPASDYAGNILKYRAAAGFLNLENPAVALAFDNGRAPAIGDVLDITKGGSTVRRTVAALLGVDIDASVLSVGYQGAAAWTSTDSAVNHISTLTYCSVIGGSLGTSSINDSAELDLLMRKYATPAPAAVGGLRATVELTCVTAGDGDSAAFVANLNGQPFSSVTNALSGADTTFVLFSNAVDTFGLTIASAAAWSVGDRIVFTLDYETAGDQEVVTPQGANIDLSAYTFYNGVKKTSDTLIVEVTAVTSTTATYRISSSSGLASITSQTVVNATPSTAVGVVYDGGQLTIAIAGADGAVAHVGQRWLVQITPPRRSATVFDKLKLNAPTGISGAIGDDELTVSGRYKFSGTFQATEAILGGANFAVGATEVSALALKTSVPGYPALSSVKSALDGEGTVSVQWRATFATSATEGYIRIDSIEDILAKFESTALESELGAAAAWALSGSQGKPVLLLNTGSPTVAAFTDALRKAETVFNARYLTLVSNDAEVLELAAPHCKAMSEESIKRFRRAYIGIDSPSEYYKLRLHADDSPYLGAVTLGAGGKYTLVTFSDADADLEAAGVTAGDLLEVAGSGERYVIAEVTGADTLLLVSGPDVPIATTALAVVAADTAENIGRYVYTVAEALGAGVEEDRRVNGVWIDDGTNDGTSIPNRFLAAEIAGLRSAAVPQKGLTRTEVLSVDAAPSMYTKFTDAVLNDMAARGVWIVMQRSPDTPCFVRHQITTAVSNGSLYYEDSAGVNLDDISFKIDALIDPTIGKSNAVSKTMSILKNKVVSMLDGLTQADSGSLVGPQIVAFYNAEGIEGTIDISLDPVMKDTFNFFIEVEIPLPFNTARIKLRGRTVRNDGVVTTTINTIAA